MLKKIVKKIVKKVFACIGRINPTLLSKILYRVSQHKKLNLKNPQLLNEKLMWLKIYLYNNDHTVWQCADKFLVRKYAKEHGVNEENLPKLLGVFKDANEIDFNSLPNKFALKCSHGCAFNIICTDKKELDFVKVRKQLNKWLNTKFGYASAETHYTHIKPCIICEKFIEYDKNKLPVDYKLYCFDGVPKFLLVTSERETGKLRLNWFDFNWNELYYGHEYDRNTKELEKPVSLNQMIKIAESVSKGFPFVRVDFYEEKQVAIMGEMTFTPAGNFAKYYNEDAQKEIGEMITLPKL